MGWLSTNKIAFLYALILSAVNSKQSDSTGMDCINYALAHTDIALTTNNKKDPNT
jgi:hypothetical protein